MFGFFKKKTQLQELIEKNGIEYATSAIAKIISDMLKSKELAYQFILEELDAARQGNEAAMKFASESGIPLSNYKGSIQNSRPEIDGAGGPQQTLIAISAELISDIDLMVDFRCKVDDKIMKNFNLGKYDKNGTSNKKVVTIRPEESTAAQDEIISKLSKLSKSNNVKTRKMEIVPINEIWSWEFKFSDEELEAARELVSILSKLRNSDFVVQVYNIVKQQEPTEDFDDDVQQGLIFNNFEEAKAWSSKNGGKAFTRNPNGNGFVPTTGNSPAESGGKYGQLRQNNPSSKAERVDDDFDDDIPF